MTDAERLERIDLLTQQAKIYAQLHDAGKLSEEYTMYYLHMLRDLDRLKEVEACRHDMMRFAKRYFNNGRIMKPETPSPPFHYEMADLIQTELNAKDRNSFVALVAPRSHAKSMIGTVASVIYSTVYKIHDYFVIISNKQDTAKDLLATVKYELMNNEELRKDFGDLYSKQNWSMMEIVTSTGVKIEAAGSGDALRGMNHLGSRPWIFCDDIEKDPDVLNINYRDKTHDWFNSTVVPLGSPTAGGTKIIWVGTILHVDSVLNRVMKNDTRFRSRRFPAIIEWPERMNLWDEWAEVLNKRDFDDVESEEESAFRAGELAREFYDKHREEMDKGAVVLWPDRMPLYDLMVIRQANRKSFLTEYIGDPRDETTKLFTAFFFYDFISDLDLMDIYGAVDPSLGKNARSDLSAIATIGRHRKTGLMDLLDMDAKRRSPDQIIIDILTKAKFYNYKAFGVETVQFQYLFMTDLAKRSALEGVYLPIKQIPTQSDKYLRIAALEPTTSNGFLRFGKHHREVISDFEDVGTDGSLPKYDDRIDAIEMAVSLIQKFKRQVAFGTL